MRRGCGLQVTGSGMRLEMFTVFSFTKRPRFLEYGDPSSNDEVGRSDYSMVNNTAFGQLMVKKWVT